MEILSHWLIIGLIIGLAWSWKNVTILAVYLYAIVRYLLLRMVWRLRWK